MKKSIILLGILVLATLGSILQARSFDDIEASGILKIGVPADYAPLAFYNKEKELVGFDIDIAKDFAKSLNLQPEFVKTSWPTLSSDLIADKYDIAMGGINYTEKREQEFLLTNPVVPNGKIALANCAIADQLTTLEKINQPNIRVAVNPGGTNEMFVNEHIKDRGATVIPTPDNVQNIQMVRENSADMMITDLIEGRYYQFKEKGVFCIPNMSPFEGTENYQLYMMKKNNDALLKTMNEWLDKADIPKIAKKWDIQMFEE